MGTLSNQHQVIQAELEETKIKLNDIEKLSKQIIVLKQTNDDLEGKMKSMVDIEQELKTKLEGQREKSDKREATLNKISTSLAQCSFFKSNDSMSIIEGVNTLAEKYEDAMIKHSETNANATDFELKLKEKEDKIKRLAVTVRKLQTVRTKLQQSLETMKEKLNQTTIKSEQYHKSLQTIHSETNRSLEK